MQKRKSKLLSMLLALVMILNAVPFTAFAAEATTNQTVVAGALSEDGKIWEFNIPEDAKGLVVLDFSAYVDKLIRSGRYGVWNPGEYATFPFTIKNSSGKIFRYADTNFSLDLNSVSDDPIYYIDGKSNFEYQNSTQNIGMHSVVRTSNQLIQNLYGKYESGLTIEMVLNAENKIKEHGEVTANGKTVAIPDTVTTYGQYALWYYNTFYGTSATTLNELPMVYKLNILGYARGIDPQGLEQGNHTIKETFNAFGMTDEEVQEQFINPKNEMLKNKSFGYDLSTKSGAKFKWVTYTTAILETDPDIIQLAKDVIYQYGIRFTFDYNPDYDKVFFVEDAPHDDLDAQNAQWDIFLNDKGELGWTTLCNTAFDANTLNGEPDTLSYAQKSIKNAIGSLELDPNGTVKYEHVYLTMPAYAVVNAHHFMGAMKGLSFAVTLKAVAPAQFDTAELGLIKKITGTALKENQFTFTIESEQTDGVHFENTTSSNTLDGIIDFGTITFDKPGTYAIKVKEVLPETIPEQWEYDKSEKVFTFTVTKEGSSLKATLTSADDKEFSNIFYAPVKFDTAQIGLLKKVSGADLKENQFNFTIESEQTDGIHFENTTASNTTDGKIDFGDITFDKVGTYAIKVKEVIPNPIPENWEYDKSEKVFTITVTKDGGVLKAVISPSDDKEFTNKFSAPAPILPPETADNTHSDLWAFAEVISLLGIATIIILNKYKKYSSR